MNFHLCRTHTFDRMCVWCLTCVGVLHWHDTDTCNYIKLIYFLKLLPVLTCQCWCIRFSWMCLIDFHKIFQTFLKICFDRHQFDHFKNPKQNPTTTTASTYLNGNHKKEPVKLCETKMPSVVVAFEYLTNCML
jgi:hypothetical protein